MGKYGFTTFGRACMNEKFEIMEVVKKYNMKPEDVETIISAYDEAVYQGRQAMASGCVLERLSMAKINMPEYIAEMARETARWADDYHYGIPGADSEENKED